jgi:hypothetical protein
MKKQIQKGLYIAASTFAIMMSLLLTSYLFVCYGSDTPFTKYAIDFLFFLSTMVLFGGCTMLITSAVYMLSKEGYKKLFTENEKNS